MKIVIATPILYDSTSPFNHLFRDILEALIQKGNQITRLVAVENRQDTQGCCPRQYYHQIYQRLDNSLPHVPQNQKAAGGCVI